ncbi:MAG: binding-protein-dependent transport system inner rane component, partial [Microbacteriaceae bacterium]|nr:binding-protein-dependent transport system inner rane component [Microbacteriaceae bacterium]
MTSVMERTTSRHAVRVLSGYSGGVILGAVVWQVVGSIAPHEVFASLSDTLARLWQIILDGTLGTALWTSFQTYLVGMAFALVIGAFGGLLLARRQLLRIALEPYIIALYATP